MNTLLSLDAVVWWTLKGSAIAAIALTATALLRRRPAAVRHAIWTIAVIAQLLIPVAPRFVPEQTLAVSVPVRTIAAQPAAEASQETPTAQPRATSPMNIETRVLLLLAVGTALFLARLLYGTLRVAWIARRAVRVVDGGWLSLVQQHSESLAIRRPVTLLATDRIEMPVTWGFVYPTILLPTAAHEWPATLRRHVLLHELAHIRRTDAMTQLAGQLAVALFWFNPLVWLAVRRMRAEAENACDDYVLRDGERPSVYATTLVDLVRAHVRAELPAFAALSVGRRSDLEARVRAITHPLRDASSRRVLLAVAVAATLAIMLPLSAVQRAVREATEPAKAASISRIDCKPLLATGFEFSETSGTLTNDGKTTHYFFLRPQPDRCIEASFPMDTRFTDDDRDVAIAPGGEALIREKRGDLDRAVTIDGNSRRFTVNGRAQSWDPRAERWYRALMPEIIRRTSAGIDDRAQRIVARDGVEGLFAEVLRIPDVSVRRQYLVALLPLRSAAELPREQLIETARNALSEFEPEDARFLAALVEREGANARIRALILDATAELRDDSDKRTVIDAMTKHRDRSVRVAAMEAIDLLPGDVWRRTVLVDAAPNYLGTNPQLVDAWFGAMDKMRDARERREVAEAILAQEHPAAVMERIRR